MAARKPYPSDLSDREWQRLAPLVPAPRPGGRPADYDRREIVNAVLYWARNGCAWRALPHDLPPYGIVFHYFRLWRLDGTWERIHDTLRGDLRQAAGRKREPSVAILDSQSVKTTEKGGRNAATMPPRRSAGASATSWSTRSASS
jgi:transposase